MGDGGDTVKWLCALAGGARVETVLMHYRDRTTVCVSTQAGCAMGCGFCATGQAGFRAPPDHRRDRRAGGGGPAERPATRTAGSATWCSWAWASPSPTTTGCGRRGALHDDLGLSARHLTLSTVGLVPGIRRLAGEDLPVNLAVSLHAANDHLRNELVPINKRYPLSVLMGACADYLRATGRRLSFEWALIDGTNDRPEDAERLAELCRSLPLPGPRQPHPAQPHARLPHRGTPPAGVAGSASRSTTSASTPRCAATADVHRRGLRPAGGSRHPAHVVTRGRP